MAEAHIHRPLLERLIRFSAVGGIAFLIDIGVLQSLIALEVSPYLARAISIPAAMLAAWQLNRRFTFAASGRRVADEGLRYAIVATVAAIVNYAVYAALIALVPSLWPAFAAGLGVATSMWVSFFGFQAFAFAQKQSD
ncbi:MAG: GtrA family protein [Hyphomonadaceae bacterium]